MATLRDVAMAADVSTAAVSRILNNDDTLAVPFETRQKVIAAAKKLGYTKKPRAGIKSSFTLGILQWFSSTQEIEDHYYLTIRQGIEDFCLKHCIQIVRAYKTDVNYLEFLKNVDSLICIGKFSQNEVKEFQKIAANVIFLDMSTNDTSCSTLTLDFDQAVMDTMNYLTELGHTHIGFLGGLEYLEDGTIFPDKRKTAFIRYCKQHSLTYKPYFKEGEFSSRSGYLMMSEILTNEHLPTAVFAASDGLAMGAMRAIHERNLHVPEDISIIGFNDTNLANFIQPALTTIHAPAYDMGSYGANIAYHMQNEHLNTAMRITLPCKLVKRESCQKL